MACHPTTLPAGGTVSADLCKLSTASLQYRRRNYLQLQFSLTGPHKESGVGLGLKEMVLGFVLLGVFAGTVAFAVVLGFGGSIWSAVATYTLVGAAVLGLTGLVLLLLGRGQAASEDGDCAETEDTPPRPAARPVVTSAVVEPTPMHILAVDDDPFILELIPKIAASAGFRRVTTAGSARAALDLIAAAARPFDCLLLDISMPEVSGIDLCAQVRRLAAYSETPIIMLTAMNDLDHMNRAFQAGASDYTTKPFDIVDFGDRLQCANARILAERSLTDHPVRFRSDDGVTLLPEVPALVKATALARYVSRLSGSALTGAYVMAVAVEADTVDLPAANLPTLARAAVAIDGIFGKSRHLLAHTGGGVFVIVSSGSVMPDACAVRDELWHRLTGKNDRSLEQPIGVAVGQPIRLQKARSERSRIAFEIAIGRATGRSARVAGTGAAAGRA